MAHRCPLRGRRADRLAAHEGLNDDHRVAALQADEAWLAGNDLRIAFCVARSHWHRVEQLARSPEVRLVATVGEQTAVADAIKAARQDVQQDAVGQAH